MSETVYTQDGHEIGIEDEEFEKGFTPGKLVICKSEKGTGRSLMMKLRDVYRKAYDTVSKRNWEGECLTALKEFNTRIETQGRYREGLMYMGGYAKRFCRDEALDREVSDILAKTEGME